MPDAAQTAGNILRAVAGGLTSVAPLASGPWRVAMTAVGALSELVADLVDHGVDPVVAVREMRSALPDYHAARDRLKHLVDSKTAHP